MRGSILLLITGMALGGCGLLERRELERDHLAYNHAVSVTETRELLLNVVRVRYADPIKFLTVDHITTSFTVEAEADVTAGVDDGAGTATIAPSARFSKTPTITFTPQGDAKFAENLLTPSSLEHIAMTLDAMADMESGLRLVVEEINDARDVAGEAGQLFRERARVLGTLKAEDRIDFTVVHKRDQLGIPISKASLTHEDVLQAVKEGYGYEEVDPQSVVLVGLRRAPGILIVHKDDAATHERLLAMGVSPQESVVDLRSSVDVGKARMEKGAIYVSPRSVLSMMAVLARGVDVPAEHRCAGIAPLLSSLPGGGGPGDLIRIHSGTQRPASRFAVRHRQYWFWIDDSDVRSKESFANLVAFYTLRLKATPTESGRPVLTLPVGGG